MLKKTITYVDYNGTSRTEDYYFNLSKAELLEMELGTAGAMTEALKKISSTKDVPTIAKIFKDMILKAYGEKSPDGKRFVKSEELSTAFSQTEAYSQLYTELLTDADIASEFFIGIIPAEAAKAIKESGELEAVKAGM